MHFFFIIHVLYIHKQKPCISFLSSMFYIFTVDLVSLFFAEYNSALTNILCIFSLITQFKIDYFWYFTFINYDQIFAIFVFCIIVLRTVGHSLKSGMNEVINILGYNLTQSLWYGICLSEEANVFLYSAITNQWNEPGRVAQTVGHLTRKSGVQGSTPGLATYFRFSFL